MELNNLTAISPVDGRYRKQIAHLDEYFSEYALIKYRVIVETEYFLFLADKKIFKLWEGLGYYTRCRNLIATARFIAKEKKGN